MDGGGELVLGCKAIVDGNYCERHDERDDDIRLYSIQTSGIEREATNHFKKTEIPRAYFACCFGGIRSKEEERGCALLVPYLMH